MYSLKLRSCVEARRIKTTSSDSGTRTGGSCRVHFSAMGYAASLRAAGIALPQWEFLNTPAKAPAMNEKQVLDELRTIKIICVANFIELQEIRRKLEIAEQTREDGYEYANHTAEHVAAMSQKLLRLLKDDLPNLWENNLGKPGG